MNRQSTLTPLTSKFADDPDMTDLIEMFVNDLPQQIESLRTSFEQRHFQDLQVIAHQIKGAGGGYGYPSLTNAASSLEDSIKQDARLENVQRALNDLIQLCQRAQLTSN